MIYAAEPPTATAKGSWSNRWKAAPNAFDITFDGRRRRTTLERHAELHRKTGSGTVSVMPIRSVIDGSLMKLETVSVM
jgi:hypothetical protein